MKQNISQEEEKAMKTAFNTESLQPPNSRHTASLTDKYFRKTFGETTDRRGLDIRRFNAFLS